MTGPSGSPPAIETEFGWVLSGNADTDSSPEVGVRVTVCCHAAAALNDDILRKFWEIEEPPMSTLGLSPDECTVLHHFKENHSGNEG